MSSKFGSQQALLPQAVPRDFSDHVFHSPDGIDLSVRVWLPPAGSRPCPWIFWTHGGAYCSGAHYAPPSWVVPAFRARGIAVVTTAYRLSPHVGLEQMLEDCQAGFTWCQANLADLGVDVASVAIGGDSSGGTLSTILGARLKPRAVVDVYGPVDFVTLDAVTPLPDLTPRPGATYVGVPEHVVVAEYTARDPARAIIAAPFGWEIDNVPETDTARRWAAAGFTYSPRVRLQTALKEYMGPRKLTWRTALRVVDLTGDERATALRAASAHHLADTSYPPTVFLHGADDAAVPPAQSIEFARKLKSLGVDVEEYYEPGAPHGFDQAYTGPDIEGWDEYIAPVVEFVLKHVTRE